MSGEHLARLSSTQFSSAPLTLTFNPSDFSALPVRPTILLYGEPFHSEQFHSEQFPCVIKT
jgi:hypothetical protein